MRNKATIWIPTNYIAKLVKDKKESWQQKWVSSDGGVEWRPIPTYLTRTELNKEA